MHQSTNKITELKYSGYMLNILLFDAWRANQETSDIELYPSYSCVSCKVFMLLWWYQLQLDYKFTAILQKKSIYCRVRRNANKPKSAFLVIDTDICSVAAIKSFEGCRFECLQFWNLKTILIEDLVLWIFVTWWCIKFNLHLTKSGVGGL